MTLEKRKKGKKKEKGIKQRGLPVWTNEYVHDSRTEW